MILHHWNDNSLYSKILSIKHASCKYGLSNVLKSEYCSSQACRQREINDGWTLSAWKRFYFPRDELLSFMVHAVATIHVYKHADDNMRSHNHLAHNGGDVRFSIERIFDPAMTACVSRLKRLELLKERENGTVFE